MKKLKKVTILCLIAAISVLIAIGCTNDNSSDEPEATPAAAATEDTQTPAATTDTTTTTTTDTSSSGTEGTEEGNEESGCTCDSDCASTNLCNVASGTCVECLSSDDCGNGFICANNNTCVRAQPACDSESYWNGTECTSCPDPNMIQNITGDDCVCKAGYRLDDSGNYCIVDESNQ